MTHVFPILLIALAAAGAGVATAGTPRVASVGVIVDTTRGADPAAVRAGRAEVSRLRARGIAAQLRVTRSPSESVAAAATLVTRGADTLVTRGVAGDTVAGPLRHSRPDVRVVRR